jgi:hypothetical protein
MPGVTHIQVQTVLYFDDGFVVTLTSPVMGKDIRRGDYFPDEEIAEIVSGCGAHMAQIIEKKTAIRMHNETRAYKDSAGRPVYWRKPNLKEPFSNN